VVVEVHPKVSALKNYKLAGFSVEHLIRFLTALGQTSGSSSGISSVGHLRQDRRCLRETCHAMLAAAPSTIASGLKVRTGATHLSLLVQFHELGELVCL